ncbi:MAG TPA: acetate/propionate family kinase [Pilimelia sp.]|nr:acetate/propionate family kinase [Pilimelia sp.]
MILVLNRGSSTLKYRLFPAAGDGAAAAVGGVLPVSGAASAGAAFARVAAQAEIAAALTAVAHRVVHGGDRFRAATLVDAAVLRGIRALAPLAPAHQEPAADLIAAAAARWPDLPQVAVFDTAFHATLPAAAATYAIDAAVARRHHIRRYGMHGISHAYVVGRTAALLGRPVAALRLIVLHLGNGASAAAVAGGRSVETSMGLTPLEGLVMGSRCGDLDPAVPGYLHRVAGLDWPQVDAALGDQAGLRGLCGDGDMRAVLARRAAGDPAAALAFDVYCHRLRKYVGAYLAVLGGAHAVVFTGGVGEHAAPVRAAALAGLGGLGIAVDDARNRAAGTQARIVSPEGCPVAVCVVPTDEERAIADEARAALARR